MCERTVDWMVQKIFGLLASTWRVKYVGLTEFIQATGRQGIAVGLWHEDFCIVAFSMRHHSNRFAPLVSKSKDGDRAAAWLKALGYHCVRGSSSKGGHEALLELEQRLNGKGSVAITVDGPRGPRRMAKSGIFRLHESVGTGLWMIRTHARGWRLPTWDKQLIPWPFSVVEVSFNEFQGELVSLEMLQDWLASLD